MGYKDERLSKQLGDFGEQLIMFIIGRLYEQRVAYVDHVGADIIATDGNERRAISVKTRVIGENENDLQYIERDHQEKLSKFSKDFGLIPAVAFIFIEPVSLTSDFNIDIYIIDLETLDLLSQDSNKIGISKLENGKIGFSNAPSHHADIRQHEKIKYHRIVFKSN